MNIEDPDLIAHALIFAKVAEHGSFTQAAKHLGMSKSAVSARVRRLEEELQVQLLTRTTRAVRLTDEGATFLETLLRVRERWHDATALLADRHQEPVGVLRITAPVTLSDVWVTPIVCEMMDAHPRLDVHLMPEDSNLDLLHHNIDLAIRVGHPADSSMLISSLGSEHGWVAVGSESPWVSLLMGGPEETARALEAIPWIGAPDTTPEITLTPRDAGPTLRLRPRYRAWAHNGQGLLSLVCHGAGAAILPDSMMLAAGDAVCVVLPTHTAATYSLWALRPAQSYTPSRVLLFLQALRDRLEMYRFRPPT